MEAGLARLARQLSKLARSARQLISRINFSCVYRRKFHSACLDNFVVLTVVKNSLRHAVSLNFHAYLEKLPSR
jgi:hypothetical protein